MEYIKKTVIPTACGFLMIISLGVVFGMAVGHGFLKITKGQYFIIFDPKEWEQTK